jgi:transcriptional antiterminator NusG
MWYAIQITIGQEQETMALCRTLIRDRLLQSIVNPQTEILKKYHGQWNKLLRPMFPGYLFVITDDVELLFQQFHQVPKLTRILGTDKVPVELSDEEVHFLKRILNPEGIVEISRGILIGDTLKIQSGPLIGMEGNVTRIDRHKREVRLKVEMMGQELEVTLGLEVVEKIEESIK